MDVNEFQHLLMQVTGGQSPEQFSVLSMNERGYRFLQIHNFFRSLTITSASGVLTLNYDPFTINVTTLGENVTSVPFPDGVIAGNTYELVLVQDGTGSRTIGGWDSNFLWEGGSAPTLTAAAGSVDLIRFTAVEIGSTMKLISRVINNAS